MTDDLVKRLRYLVGQHIGDADIDDELSGAADRIEKLEMTARGVPIRDMTALSKALDRIEKLEAALRSIAANACCDSCREAALVARKALEDKQ